MNRLEKLKNKLAEKHYKETSYVPTEWAVMNFFSGFDAASSEYEKIIAELEAAIEHYLEVQKFLAAPQEDNCVSSSDFKEALKKLKEFRGGE